MESTKKYKVTIIDKNSKVYRYFPKEQPTIENDRFLHIEEWGSFYFNLDNIISYSINETKE